MAELSKEEVKRVAEVARLAITEEEAEEFAQQLVKFSQYADQLKELSLDDIAPMTHVLEQVNVLREDIPSEGLDREKMLQSVPEHEDGMIKVPAILS